MEYSNASKKAGRDASGERDIEEKLNETATTGKGMRLCPR
jgi:hypothetical protein